MFPNHWCHPCVKWVSHRWRSHYLWSVRMSPHFGDHPHRSQRLCNIPPLLLISRGAVCIRFYFQQPWFDGRCESALPWGTRRSSWMDSWFPRTDVDELFSWVCFFFTPRTLRNKMTVVEVLSLPVTVTLWVEADCSLRSRPSEGRGLSRSPAGWRLHICSRLEL